MLPIRKFQESSAPPLRHKYSCEISSRLGLTKEPRKLVGALRKQHRISSWQYRHFYRHFFYTWRNFTTFTQHWEQKINVTLTTGAYNVTFTMRRRRRRYTLWSLSWMFYKVVVLLNQAIFKCLPGLFGTLPRLWGRQVISYEEVNIS